MKEDSVRLSFVTVLAAIGLTLAVGASTASLQPVSAWAAPPEGKRLVIRYDTDSMLDPAHFSLFADQGRVHQIYNALVRYKPGSAAIEPDLAERWSVSSDGKTYTFHLRKGVKWHRGYGEFTARDVKCSFERILDPATKSAWAGELSVIDKIDVVDNYSVTIAFKQAGESMLHKVAAFRQGYLVNCKAVQDFGASYKDNPIGTGPYMLKERVPGQRTVLQYFPEYFEGPAKIGEVEFRVIPEDSVAVLALEKGEIDVLAGVQDTDLYQRLMRNRDIKVWVQATTGVQGISFDIMVKPTSDLRVRQAIAHLLDRKSLVENVARGIRLPAVGHLSSAFPQATTGGLPSYPYDPARAKRLLTEAKVTQLEARIPKLGVLIDLFTVLQDELRKVGVKLDVEVLELGVWIDATRRAEAPLTAFSFGPRPDPDILLSTAFHSSSFPPGSNISRYNRIDKLIEQARYEMNDGRRAAVYHEIQRKLMQDLPAYPVYWMTYIDAVGPRVSGWNPRLFNPWRLYLVDVVR